MKEFYAQLQADVEYETQTNLNLYSSVECTSLVTQAAVGRHLRIMKETWNDFAIKVCLCEDDYPGWVAISDLGYLQPSTLPYQAQSLSLAEIEQLLPGAIAFTYKAMEQPNYYLWGGTVGPNYDCSGLMQAAFEKVGIRIPRDSYQQEAFVEPICTVDTFDQTLLKRGDLIFFGTPQKANHVGLYLGEGRYIHSSGKDIGRNGIGIDCLSEQSSEIGRSYYQLLRGAGRVVQSYQPHKQRG